MTIASTSSVASRSRKKRPRTVPSFRAELTSVCAVNSSQAHGLTRPFERHRAGYTNIDQAEATSPSRTGSAACATSDACADAGRILGRHIRNEVSPDTAISPASRWTVNRLASRFQLARNLDAAGPEHIAVGADHLAVEHDLRGQVKRLEAKPSAALDGVVRGVEKPAIAPHAVFHPARILGLCADIGISDQAGAQQVEIAPRRAPQRRCSARRQFRAAPRIRDVRVARRSTAVSQVPSRES